MTLPLQNPLPDTSKATLDDASRLEAASSPNPLTAHPIPATIAVVVKDEQVLLVRRANPPDAGYWGFPGGKINLGETLQQAAVRELAEETGIQGQALQVITTIDAFSYDEDKQLTAHFLLVAVLCEWLAGTPVAADDALEAKWFSLCELQDDKLLLSKDVAEVAQLGVSYLRTTAHQS